MNEIIMNSLGPFTNIISMSLYVVINHLIQHIFTMPQQLQNHTLLQIIEVEV